MKIFICQTKNLLCMTIYFDYLCLNIYLTNKSVTSQKEDKWGLLSVLCSSPAVSCIVSWITQTRAKTNTIQLNGTKHIQLTHLKSSFFSSLSFGPNILPHPMAYVTCNVSQNCRGIGWRVCNQRATPSIFLRCLVFCLV